MKKPSAEQIAKLTPSQVDICIKAGTEAPFSGKLLNNKKQGKYMCVVCGNELFSSELKFDSGSGWPSFTDALKKENVTLKDDFTHNMVRTEALCSNCGSHLGHVFDDGPVEKGGKRFCINSLALDFKEEE